MPHTDRNELGESFNLDTMARYTPRVITEVKLTKLTKGATHA